MSNNSRHSTVLALGFGAALAGCGNVSGTDTPNVGKPMTYQHGSDATTTFSPGATGLQYNAGSSALVDPVVDYMLALRTASLKLRGNLPSLLEQENLKNAIDSGNADDAQNTYESLVKGYINNSPALFNKQMFHF